MGNSIHSEPHLSERNNWLRAGVLGANDGLISTASLLMGMVASGASAQIVLLTGVASLIGGALSMGAGEYISVSSQKDTERADLQKERYELTHNPKRELQELTMIYEQRGLSPELAAQVAQALTAHDALAAHARDEIGLSDTLSAKPLQAALSSVVAFALGALLPLISVWILTRVIPDHTFWGLGMVTVAGLALLGAISARLGGAPIMPALTRVVVWGVVAMGVTAGVGHLFGTQLA